MKKVAIIAGHRGAGTGANGFIDEGAETIWLRDRIDDFLTAKYNIVAFVDNDTSGLSVVVKRLKDTMKKDDLCIDIHFDAFTNPDSNGCTVFIPNRPTSDEKLGGQQLVDLVSKVTGIRSRGVKLEGAGQHSSLAMLSGFDCCNLLLEVGFVSNKSDSDKYNAKKDALAEAIADWVYKFTK